MFSAINDKHYEDVEVFNEIGFLINLNINEYLTETDIDNTEFLSQLERQIQNQETKDSGWRFDKTNSMTIQFYESTGLNGSNFVKVFVLFSTNLNFQIGDQFCLLWSVLGHHLPCRVSHPVECQILHKKFS